MPLRPLLSHIRHRCQVYSYDVTYKPLEKKIKKIIKESIITTQELTKSTAVWEFPCVLLTSVTPMQEISQIWESLFSLICRVHTIWTLKEGKLWDQIAESLEPRGQLLNWGTVVPQHRGGRWHHCVRPQTTAAVKPSVVLPACHTPRQVWQSWAFVHKDWELTQLATACKEKTPERHNEFKLPGKGRQLPNKSTKAAF